MLPKWQLLVAFSAEAAAQEHCITDCVHLDICTIKRTCNKNALSMFKMRFKSASIRLCLASSVCCYSCIISMKLQKCSMQQNS